MKILQSSTKNKNYLFFISLRGVIVSKNDPQKKKKLYMIFLPTNMQQFHYVGRLDYNTEGLLLLTNNGKLKKTLRITTK
ncbi:MAG: pseudouridine synthase [Dehalococcoidia bacterium]